MIESVMFVGFSLVISIVPDKKKNFGKICLVGAILYTLSMFFEGPVIGLPTSRKTGIYYIGLGIALGGIGGACIMPAAMPALDECLRGCFPPSKDSQVKNAMGALVAGAFGTGNFLGTIVGGVMSDIFKSPYCV
jgi:MFS family permease